MKWLDFFVPLDHIIMGDLNAHLSLLGYPKEDERGKILTYLLLSNNLTLINDIEAPHSFIGQPNRPMKGRPDVTLCTQDLLDCVDSWYVDDTVESTSDYRYIRFSLNLKPVILDLKRFKTRHTNFKKINYILKPKINNLLKSLSETKTRLELDEWLDGFNQVILETCKSSLKTKRFKLYPSFDWWTAELKAQRNKISALRKRFKSTNDPK